MSAFRAYLADELGSDGYPREWHRLIVTEPSTGVRTLTSYGVKDLVREEAGNRCERCRHPYRSGEHGSGEWSRCDDECDHEGPVRMRCRGEFRWSEVYDGPSHVQTLRLGEPVLEVEAQWRILTVHHLDGDKANCRWWNLVALCQRCHLSVQGRVLLARVWPWEHSEWFKPYVAGYYAFTYLGQDLTRKQVEAAMDDLLALERMV